MLSSCSRTPCSYTTTPLPVRQDRLARILPGKLDEFEPRIHLPDGRVQGSPPRADYNEPCGTGSAASSYNLGSHEYFERRERRL